MSRVQVTVWLRGVSALKKKEVNDILKEGFYLMGRRWRQLYLPLHFGDRATQRYRYTLRSGARFAHNPKRYHRTYSGRKVKFLGHNRPLEFSGEGKRQAMTQEKITATRRSVKIKLPPKFNWRHPKSEVRMADEIRRVRPDEAAALRKFLAAHIRETLRKSGAKKSTVVVRAEP